MTDKLEQILQSLDFSRGLILDSVEAELFDSPTRWEYVRSRLLKILGDRGLEGRIKDIVCNQKNSNTNSTLEETNAKISN